jgi:hypothetical protein
MPLDIGVELIDLDPAEEVRLAMPRGTLAAWCEYPCAFCGCLLQIRSDHPARVTPRLAGLIYRCPACRARADEREAEAVLARAAAAIRGWLEQGQ